MERKRVIATLLSYPIEYLTKHETKYLYDNIKLMRNLYIEGLSVSTLSRQSGLSLEELQYLFNHFDTYIQQLEERLKIHRDLSRDSVIYPDNEVFDLLVKRKHEIIELIKYGEKMESVCNMLQVVPSRKTWEKFRKYLKGQGITFKALTELANEEDEMEMTV